MTVGALHDAYHDATTGAWDGPSRIVPLHCSSHVHRAVQCAVGGDSVVAEAPLQLTRTQCSAVYSLVTVWWQAGKLTEHR